MRTKLEMNYINGLYGVLDGLSLSCGIVRYYFDISSIDNHRSSADLMHEWLMTPSGLAIAVAESIAAVSFSFISNTVKNDNKNQNYHFIPLYWPYFRDLFKALKNTYRGLRSVLLIISALTNNDLSSLALPAGLALGLLSALNRFMTRHIRAQRKSIMDANEWFLKSIQDSLIITPEEIRAARSLMQTETWSIDGCALTVAIYSGFTDGIGLYMGIVTLIPIASSFFIPVVVLSVCFSLAGLLSRVYELYNEQLELQLVQAKIELALFEKELQTLFLEVQEEYKKNSLCEDAIAVLVQTFNLKLQELEQKAMQVRSMINSSYLPAIFTGIRGGLAAYGAIVSLVFSTVTVCALLCLPFPLVLAPFTVFSGLVCVLGFSAYSVHAHNQYLSQQKVNGLQHKGAGFQSINETDVMRVVSEEITSAPSSQTLYQEEFEVWRSLCSSLGKSQKLADCIFFIMQERDAQGQYYDPAPLLGIIAVSSIIYASVLAQRTNQTYQEAAEKKKSSHLIPLSIVIEKGGDTQAPFLEELNISQPQEEGGAAKRCNSSAAPLPRNENIPPLAKPLTTPETHCINPTSSFFKNNMVLFGSKARNADYCPMVCFQASMRHA